MSAPGPAPPSTGLAAATDWLVGAFGRHLALFVVGNALLVAANIALPGGWWVFWPQLVWSVLLALHYLVYKTARIDDAWVDARAEELRYKSYDRGHIESIKSAPTPFPRDRAEDDAE